MAQLGRTSRGKRTQFVIRVPEYLGDVIKAGALEKQTSLTDYLGTILAEHLGVPVPPPAPRGLYSRLPPVEVEQLSLTA
jgi:hypothetical protein